MADSVQIPVEFTGWDKVISSIEGTTKASKEMGEQFKKALMGEVLVQGIQRIASGMKDGVAKETTAAAGAIAQGFFMGGPAGAAIAGFSVAVLKIGSAFDAIENKAGAAAARLALAGAQANAIRRRDEGLADVRREQSDMEIARIEAGKVRKERDEQDRIAAAAARKQALAEKKAADADAKEYIESQLLSVAYLEQGIKEEAFQEELDIEAEQAMRARDQRDADAQAERDRLHQAQMDALAVRAVETEQILALEKQRADARRAQDERSEKERNDALKAQRLSFEADMAALGGMAVRGFADDIGGAVGALAQLDAAQIAAASSSKDLGATLASAALESVQGVLASVAQEATVKAAMATATAIGFLATPGTQFLAPGKFGEAAAFAGVAALAGGGAIAAGTAAAAARPAPAPVPTQSGSTSTGSSSRGGSGGGASPTVVVNFGAAYVTEDAVGRGIEQALKKSGRYR